jgi:hypothetical protein
MTIKQLQKRIDKIYTALQALLDDNCLDLVSELVELEIQLEAECNK